MLLRVHRAIESPANHEHPVLKKLRLDPVDVAVVAQLEAPAGVITLAVKQLAVKLEQRDAGGTGIHRLVVPWIWRAPPEGRDIRVPRHRVQPTTAGGRSNDQAAGPVPRAVWRKRHTLKSLP